MSLKIICMYITHTSTDKNHIFRLSALYSTGRGSKIYIERAFVLYTLRSIAVFLLAESGVLHVRTAAVFKSEFCPVLSKPRGVHVCSYGSVYCCNGTETKNIPPVLKRTQKVRKLAGELCDRSSPACLCLVGRNTVACVPFYFTYLCGHMKSD